MRSSACWVAALTVLVGGCAKMEGSSLPACPASFPDDGGVASIGSLTVPMKVTRTAANGTMRFSIPIQIGDSAPIDAFLDTGSSGLRILEGAVPDSAFTCGTSTEITYSYHSGLRLDGVVAYANVTFGSATTPVPIPTMLVQKVGCTAAMPDCGAQGKSVDDFTLFGPYKAILGIGMRNAASAGGVGNPIAQLAGSPSYLVKAPSYGGTEGAVVIAPSPSEIAGFKTAQLPSYDGAPLQNGVPTWDDRFGLPACVDDATSGVDYCVPAELDSGNPPVYIEWPGQPDTVVLPAGESLHVTVGAAGDPLGQFGLTVGNVPTPGIDEVVVEPASGAGFMNLGTALFFRYDALFDQAHGIVGLAAR
jgi:hypothetical protein